MNDQKPDEQPAPAEGSLNNTKVGEFLLLRRLGSGGMADVYLAEQTSLGRSVAVKVLKADAIADPNGSCSNASNRKPAPQVDSIIPISCRSSPRAVMAG